jgi:hypothetical protein
MAPNAVAVTQLIHCMPRSCSSDTTVTLYASFMLPCIAFRPADAHFPGDGAGSSYVRVQEDL